MSGSKPYLNNSKNGFDVGCLCTNGRMHQKGLTSSTWILTGVPRGSWMRPYRQWGTEDCCWSLALTWPSWLVTLPSHATSSMVPSVYACLLVMRWWVLVVIKDIFLYDVNHFSNLHSLFTDTWGNQYLVMSSIPPNWVELSWVGPWP